jgi:GMP reductase
MDKHVGGVAEYRSSEGKAVTLPYRGLIKDTVNDILGGIRSSCTYVGARCVRVVIVHMKRFLFFRASLF